MKGDKVFVLMHGTGYGRIGSDLAIFAGDGPCDPFTAELKAEDAALAWMAKNRPTKKFELTGLSADGGRRWMCVPRDANGLPSFPNNDVTCVEWVATQAVRLQ